MMETTYLMTGAINASILVIEIVWIVKKESVYFAKLDMLKADLLVYLYAETDRWL